LRERDPGQTFFSINGSGNAATTHQGVSRLGRHGSSLRLVQIIQQV
jgi:hypothetical protein